MSHGVEVVEDRGLVAAVGDLEVDTETGWDPDFEIGANWRKEQRLGAGIATGGQGDRADGGWERRARMGSHKGEWRASHGRPGKCLAETNGHLDRGGGAHRTGGEREKCT